MIEKAAEERRYRLWMVFLVVIVLALAAAFIYDLESSAGKHGEAIGLTHYLDGLKCHDKAPTARNIPA